MGKTIIILNGVGQLVYSSLAKKGSTSVDISTCSTGNYMVRLYSNDGQFYTSQFQKL
jgi:hypothetical protein